MGGLMDQPLDELQSELREKLGRRGCSPPFGQTRANGNKPRSSPIDDAISGGMGPPPGIEPDSWGNVPKPERVFFTWFPYIVQGALNVLAGMPGCGKGLVAMDIASRITRGDCMPLGSKSAFDGKVLWCETEDPRAQVLAPRAIAAAAKKDNMRLAGLGDAPMSNLRDVITTHGVKLVVLSPFISFIDGLEDGNNEAAVRNALEPLARAVEGTECAILGIMHPSKKTEAATLDRIMGSRAFTAFVRSVVVIAERDEQKRLCHIKHNLSIKGRDAGFAIKDVGRDPSDGYVRIEWANTEDNWFVEGLWDKRQQSKPSAKDWLVEHLSNHGPTMREDVMEAAGKAGYKLESVHKAAQREKRIKSRRLGFQGSCEWSIAD